MFFPRDAARQHSHCNSNLEKRQMKRFLAVLVLLALAGTAQAQWQARHNLTPAQFQTTFNDLFQQGYRLKTVSGYVSGGSERYAGLWVKENGPAWQARNVMSATDYQKAFEHFF